MGDGRRGGVAEGEERASTGIAGLDLILRGGFTRDEMHLVQGAAGTGKTTLAIQFLLAGLAAGESGLYITLSQTRRGLERIARSHGFSLDGLTVYELAAGGAFDPLAGPQTVLHTADVELGELTQELRRIFEQAHPRRAVFDSIGVLALLSGSRARYHRELLLLRRFLAERGCTALFLGDAPAGERLGEGEIDLVAGSVIHLEQEAPDYGEIRRTVRVIKVRGVPFQGGHHNFRVDKGGLSVYARPQSPAEEYREFKPVRSGIEALDALLGGGVEQGTTVLLVGPPGSGKSTLAAVYANAAARAGAAAAVILFEERPETFKVRAQSVGLDLEPHVESGRVRVEKIDTAQISPGELGQKVRAAVEELGAKLVVLDSLTGYFNAMGNGPMLVPQMHDLITYLSRKGALTLLTVSQEGFMTVGTRNSVDVSYLSDTIILLRMFEAGGAIRRCIAVVKKRCGEHETSIRELFIHAGGVEIGEAPLSELRHILGGEPEPAGEPQRA